MSAIHLREKSKDFNVVDEKWDSHDKRNYFLLRVRNCFLFIINVTIIISIDIKVTIVRLGAVFVAIAHQAISKLLGFHLNCIFT